MKQKYVGLQDTVYRDGAKDALKSLKDRLPMPQTGIVTGEYNKGYEQLLGDIHSIISGMIEDAKTRER